MATEKAAQRGASVYHSQGTFEIARCTHAGCTAIWEKYCKACNLVYCVAHLDPKIHNCRTGKAMGPY